MNSFRPSTTLHENRLSRRSFVSGLLGATCLAGVNGCLGPAPSTGDTADLVIGQRGLSEGRFQKPRAMAIDKQDTIYTIDKTGRIQVFDTAGQYLRGWGVPAIENGKPTGVTIDSLTGNVLVADTHYFRFLTYTPDGTLLNDKTIGGTNGPEPGQFGWVTDIVRAPTGNLYLAEYGEFDRIYKYSPDGQYIDRFGEHGDGPLQFSRPQSLDVDDQGFLWIADSCNHRIQVVDWREDKPRSVAVYGSQGNDVGQLRFPYGMTLSKNNTLLVSEFGNHRVQRWERSGKPIATWGGPGHKPGQLSQPWAVACDSKQRVYVIDSGNNRVQRFSI